ncbi:MAG: aromatic ring-hydroxylating dioxygenase subunit alpha [Hyphomonadaceae bacterium]|jgi:phenylpropionate dioxygenase-like ring-hydroxylating dioxygenase large terminal subunit|nr:aromatic ring-hydroxylating dioxygenase subunit alpha [Hyphomonadaceae bacterium]
MSELLRDLWYFAATSRELKRGQMFRREILGEPVLLGRDEEGKAFALRDICPHRAVPLSAGRIVAENGVQTVECPYHGWRFGTQDGVCKHIPTLLADQPYEVDRIRVRRLPTSEANGIVLVFVSSDPRAAEASSPPPEFHLGDFQEPKFVIHRIFAATMDNAVVGLMDPAHVPYVHNQWWWRPPSAGKKLKQKLFVPRERGWAIERHAPSGNSLAYRMLFGGNVTTEISFMLPGFRWEVVENETARLFTLTCLTPENEKSTRITQVTYWKNAPLLDAMKPILVPAGREFLDQDGRMVDLQNEGLRYSPSMLWIDDIDVQAKWYLKLKREWTKSREEKRAFVNPIEPTTLRWMS